MVEWLLIVYILISGILLWARYRQTPRNWILRWVLVAAFPLIGWLFPVFWPKSWLRPASPEQMEELFEHDGKGQQLSAIQMEFNSAEELNVVSIEEALLVNEHADRRRVMIQVLKQDAFKYMDILKKAISNEDTETSHYAVSAVMEIKRKLTLSMQELSVQYESNKQDPAVLQAYGEVLDQYMNSGFLDEKTLRNYRVSYIQVLDELIGIDPGMESAYQGKMESELELGLLREAERTAQLYLERFPQSEEAYLGLVKIYYHMRSYDNVQTVLELLKKSPLTLSNRALTLVRYWSGGAYSERRI
ncbi:tetratricopeptide repeat protein [Paenibacillus vini]|uniref:Uncharacterized protein n=1 Tax=Paenibacillus vini TaxID=1476024 RepID=A0ABQ4M5Y5_9BACL|nr:hypothetical protein [Paenibacillus vini]GIP51420.1 hypothetical protein J42TS3_04550 [Paenibacillus vini]